MASWRIARPWAYRRRPSAVRSTWRVVRRSSCWPIWRSNWLSRWLTLARLMPRRTAARVRLPASMMSTSRDSPPRAIVKPQYTQCPFFSTIVKVHKRMKNADRKSTRLNSSHTVISYAVFCLKKKKQDAVDIGNMEHQALRGVEQRHRPPADVRQLLELVAEL